MDGNKATNVPGGKRGPCPHVTRSTGAAALGLLPSAGGFLALSAGDSAARLTLPE